MKKMRNNVKTIDISDVDQETLFDGFADNYDLLLPNWENDLKEQAIILDRFFKKYAPKPLKKILDCTCGIGTQSIGLGLLGYDVTGTDISGKSIQRAIKEARRMGVDIEFKKADIRLLSDSVTGNFDAVISCDNSLPALLSEADVALGIANMFQRLDPSGICIISIRNYDRIFAEKKCFHPRQIHYIEGNRLIVFDVWDYQNDEFLCLNVFYLYEQESGWKAECRPMVYRAIYTDDFIRILKHTGFGKVDVINNLDGVPLQFDYYICKP